MEERKGFGSNFGFLMAAVGSAVGLGNIWGFPNKMGACGGFTFLIIYLILAALCGFIVMVGELALGRKTGRGAVDAYRTLSKKFKWLGWLGILSAFLILAFYCALGGYCIKYVTVNFGNLIGAGFGSGGLGGGDVFGGILTNQLEAVIYGLIFVLITLLIVMGGVGAGIEKVCSVGMPALFVLLVICIVRSLTLGGNEFEVAILQADGSTVVQTIQSSALDGLKYMFQPGYVTGTGYYEPAKALVDGAMVAAIDGIPVVKHITEVPNFFSVLSTAGGQMFFSLSLGMGAMITYGSYLGKKQNLEKNALIIVIMDTLIALMAGLAVMPGRFALDASGAVGGPKLLFITMQNVFDKMGAIGPVFGILFYLLVVFAAISSSISLLEVIVAHFVDKARIAGKGDKRKPYAVIAGIASAVLCVLVCVDGLGENGIAPAALLNIEASGWSDCWLDFFDCVSEGIMMPLGALLMCLCIGWEIGPKVVDEECCVEGQSFKSKGFFNICVKFITPIIMILVLAGQLDSFFGFGWFS